MNKIAHHRVGGWCRVFRPAGYVHKPGTKVCELGVKVLRAGSAAEDVGSAVLFSSKIVGDDNLKALNGRKNHKNSQPRSKQHGLKMVCRTERTVHLESVLHASNAW